MGEIVAAAEAGQVKLREAERKEGINMIVSRNGTRRDALVLTPRTGPGAPQNGDGRSCRPAQVPTDYGQGCATPLEKCPRGIGTASMLIGAARGGEGVGSAILVGTPLAPNATVRWTNVDFYTVGTVGHLASILETVNSVGAPYTRDFVMADTSVAGSVLWRTDGGAPTDGLLFPAIASRGSASDPMNAGIVIDYSTMTDFAQEVSFTFATTGIFGAQGTGHSLDRAFSITIPAMHSFKLYVFWGRMIDGNEGMAQQYGRLSGAVANGDPVISLTNVGTGPRTNGTWKAALLAAGSTISLEALHSAGVRP